MLLRKGESKLKAVLIVVGLALLMFLGKRLFEWSGASEKVQTFMGL